MESLNFVWQNYELGHDDSYYLGGQKGAIIEMFGWPY